MSMASAVLAVLLLKTLALASTLRLEISDSGVANQVYLRREAQAGDADVATRVS